MEHCTIYLSICGLWCLFLWSPSRGWQRVFTCFCPCTHQLSHSTFLYYLISYSNVGHPTANTTFTLLLVYPPCLVITFHLIQLTRSFDGAAFYQLYHSTLHSSTRHLTHFVTYYPFGSHYNHFPDNSWPVLHYTVVSKTWQMYQQSKILWYFR